MGDTQGLQELLAAMKADAALSDALGQATTPTAFIDIAAQNGYVVTADDLAGHIDEIPLSDAQLELISGGSNYEQWINDTANTVVNAHVDAANEVGRQMGLT